MQSTIPTMIPSLPRIALLCSPALFCAHLYTLTNDRDLRGMVVIDGPVPDNETILILDLSPCNLPGPPRVIFCQGHRDDNQEHNFPGVFAFQVVVTTQCSAWIRIPRLNSFSDWGQEHRVDAMIIFP